MLLLTLALPSRFKPLLAATMADATLAEEVKGMSLELN